MRAVFFFLKVELTPARLSGPPGVWTEEVAARSEFAPFSLSLSFFKFQKRSQSQSRGTFFPSAVT